MVPPSCPESPPSACLPGKLHPVTVDPGFQHCSFLHPLRAPSPVLAAWCLPSSPVRMAASSAEHPANSPWLGETTKLQLVACGLDLASMWGLAPCLLFRGDGEQEFGRSNALLLICSNWRPGLGSWKKHKTFLSLVGIHSSILGLGSSPQSVLQCLQGSYYFERAVRRKADQLGEIVLSASCDAEPKLSSSLMLSDHFWGKKKKKMKIRKKQSLVYCVDNVRVVGTQRHTFQTYPYMS